MDENTKSFIRNEIATIAQSSFPKGFEGISEEMQLLKHEMGSLRAEVEKTKEKETHVEHFTIRNMEGRLERVEYLLHQLQMKQ